MFFYVVHLWCIINVICIYLHVKLPNTISHINWWAFRSTATTIPQLGDSGTTYPFGKHEFTPTHPAVCLLTSFCLIFNMISLCIVLFFCPFSSCYYICILSVIFRLATSDYFFGIFKIFLLIIFYPTFLVKTYISWF